MKILILRFCFLVLHRYASLYFCVAIEKDDNELLTLEIIHRYVELLDKYFGSVSTVITNFAVTKSRKPYVIICFFGLLILSISLCHSCVDFVYRKVCELDIIFNFEKAYFMLDELILGGEIQETSKKNVLKAISAQDLLQEVG